MSGRPNTVLPAPLGIVAEATHALDKVTDSDTRWRVRRLVATAYGDGYADGHLAGMQEVREDERHERDQLREQLAAAEAEARTATQTLDEVASALNSGRNITIGPDGSIVSISDTPGPATPA